MSDHHQPSSTPTMSSSATTHHRAALRHIAMETVQYVCGGVAHDDGNKEGDVQEKQQTIDMLAAAMQQQQQRAEVR